MMSKDELNEFAKRWFDRKYEPFVMGSWAPPECDGYCEVLLNGECVSPDPRCVKRVEHSGLGHFVEEMRKPANRNKVVSANLPTHPILSGVFDRDNLGDIYKKQVLTPGEEEDKYLYEKCGIEPDPMLSRVKSKYVRHIKPNGEGETLKRDVVPDYDPLETFDIYVDPFFGDRDTKVDKGQLEDSIEAQLDEKYTGTDDDLVICLDEYVTGELLEWLRTRFTGWKISPQGKQLIFKPK